MEIKLNNTIVNPSLFYNCLSQNENKEKYSRTNEISKYELSFYFSEINNKFFEQYRRDCIHTKELIEENNKSGFTMWIIDEIIQELFERGWPSIKKLKKFDNGLFERVIKFYGLSILNNLDWPWKAGELKRYGIISIDNINFEKEIFTFYGEVIILDLINK